MNKNVKNVKTIIKCFLMKRESMVATFSKVNSPQIVSFSLVVAPHGEIEILSGTSKDAAAGF